MNIKSFTLEDIFHDYGNDILISCDKQGNNKIQKNIYIYSFINKNGNYKRKIKRNIYDNLKIKHYIKFGETCPICFDLIINRKDAFLTNCGHAFHYSCIIKYDYLNCLKVNGIFCPLCKQDMGAYNIIDIKDKYPYSKNEIDKLIDFENNHKFKIPKICFNIHTCKFNNHFHSMKYLDCYYCQF